MRLIQEDAHGDTGRRPDDPRRGAEFMREGRLKNIDHRTFIFTTRCVCCRNLSFVKRNDQLSDEPEGFDGRRHQITSHLWAPQLQSGKLDRDFLAGIGAP